MKTKRLYDVTDLDEVGGIFFALASYNVPWRNEVSGNILDVEYYLNISGQKRVSPLISRIIGTSEKLTSTNTSQLASICYAMYMPNWSKEYATLNLEYNPVSNYDMTETETRETTTEGEKLNTGTQTGAGTTSNTGTQTNAVIKHNTGTQATTGSTANTGTQTNATDQEVDVTQSGNSANDVYGFNSTTAVHDTSSNASSHDVTTNDETITRTDNLTESRTDTRTDNLTETENSTRTDDLASTTSNTRTDNLAENTSGTETEERTLTRSGNIGVTTSQQMIQSERELYLWNFFYNVVFPDVDKVLTIATY